MQADATVSTHRWKLFAAVMLVGLALYAWAVEHYCAPYLLFPCDDEPVFRQIVEPREAPNVDKRLFLVHKTHPGAGVIAAITGHLSRLVTQPTYTTLLHLTVVCLGVTALVGAITIYGLTQSLLAAWSFAALFLCGSWPSTYLLMYSYAAIVGAEVLIAVSLAVWIWRSPTMVFAKSLALGIVCAYCFWTAPGATVAGTLLLIASLAMLFWHRQPHRRDAIVTMVVAFAGGFTVFASLYWDEFWHHVQNNMDSPHPMDAIAKFGYVPPVPSFKFLRILWLHSPVLAVLLPAAIITTAYSGIRKWRQRASWQPAEVVLASLLALLLVHAMTVDLLPTTKLGRTHFAMYPLVCAALCVWAAVFAKGSGIAHPRKLLGVFCLVLTLAVAQGLLSAHRITELRHALPRALNDHYPGVKKIILLQEDPHAPFLIRWLGKKYQYETIPMASLNQPLLQQDGMALVIGPHGKNTGNSIMRHASLPDFIIPENILADVRRNCAGRFEYYAYCPQFLMEEEICQGIYAAGQLPSADDPASGLTLIIGKPAPLAPAP